MQIIPTIYKVDKNILKLRGLTDEEIVLKILNDFSNNITEEDLSIFQIENIEYILYAFNTNEIESEWKSFFPKTLSETKNFFQQSVALILFIKTEYDIYVVIGGNSYKIILPFIDQSFGIDTYSKIIKPTEDNITSIKARGITGNRAGFSEQYRNDFKIIDYIKFGNVPKEIQIKLDEKTSKLHFKFLLDKNIFTKTDLIDNNIWALFVHPDHDQRGIGKRLHDMMLHWYFNQQKEKVWLSTSPGTRAEKFYRMQGWKEVGVYGKGEIKFEMTREEWEEKKILSKENKE